MIAKRITVFLLFSLIYFTSFALDLNSKSFKLILNPSQVTNAHEGAMVVEVYNGYELVVSKTIDANRPLHIFLNLYCNYTLIVKVEGRESLKYNISTEVPSKTKKEWELALNLPYISNNHEAFADVKAASISYREDRRSFSVVEAARPMAEETIDTPKTLTSTQRTN